VVNLLSPKLILPKCELSQSFSLGVQGARRVFGNIFGGIIKSTLLKKKKRKKRRKNYKKEKKEKKGKYM